MVLKQDSATGVLDVVMDGKELAGFGGNAGAFVKGLEGKGVFD